MMRVVKDWSRLPKEVVDTLSLEIFQVAQRGGGYPVPGNIPGQLGWGS